MAQLPSGSEGAAGGVLFWSLTCLLCNILLLWLLWTSKEKGSCKCRLLYCQHLERALHATRGHLPSYTRNVYS